MMHHTAVKMTVRSGTPVRGLFLEKNLAKGSPSSRAKANSMREDAAMIP